MADIDWTQAVRAAGSGAGAGATTGNPWVVAGGALVGAVGNIFSQLFTNKANRDLQRESWDRMSISSRVKELEANGLNKLYAAGSMPSYNLSTSMKAPDINVGAALNAYQAAKQIELTDANTKNAKLQGMILQNEYSSSLSKAIMDKINESIAAGDYDITANRQLSGVKSTDMKELQLLGYGEKFLGVQGDNWKSIVRNLVGLDPESEEIRRLRDENEILKSNYRSVEEYDAALYDIPGVDYDAYNNPIVYDKDGYPLVFDKKNHRWIRP